MIEIGLVTIGIPMYNAEKFIRQAIVSILDQTYVNFELIITDDGSSDRSFEIATSFQDPRIIVLKDGKNKGISHRLNQQIDLAKGKYFVRMDADDIMFPDRIEKQVNFLEQNPEVDVVGSSAVIIGDENEIIGIREPLIPEDDDYILKANIFIHPSVCGKLSWFKKYRYDSKIDGAEDYDLWIRGWKDSTFKNILEPLLFYRDPLEFKLNTYLDRLKKQRTMWDYHAAFQNNLALKIKLIISSHFKGFAASVLNFMGQDEMLIARRNKVINNPEKFQKILLQLLNKKNEGF